MVPKVELRKFGKSLEYHQLYTPLVRLNLGQAVAV